MSYPHPLLEDDHNNIRTDRGKKRGERVRGESLQTRVMLTHSVRLINVHENTGRSRLRSRCKSCARGNSIQWLIHQLYYIIFMGIKQEWIRQSDMLYPLGSFLSRGEADTRLVSIEFSLPNTWGWNFRIYLTIRASFVKKNKDGRIDTTIISKG